eukprot:8158559-Heterocapsa_arctica.AAC.1
MGLHLAALLPGGDIRDAVPDRRSRPLTLGAGVLPEPQIILPCVEVFWCRVHRVRILVGLSAGEFRHGIRRVRDAPWVGYREVPLRLGRLDVPRCEEQLLLRSVGRVISECVGPFRHAPLALPAPLVFLEVAVTAIAASPVALPILR